MDATASAASEGVEAPPDDGRGSAAAPPPPGDLNTTLVSAVCMSSCDACPTREKQVPSCSYYDLVEEARPSLIPSLCTHFTHAGIEWRR